MSPPLLRTQGKVSRVSRESRQSFKGNFWDLRESQQGFKGKYEVPVSRVTFEGFRIILKVSGLTCGRVTGKGKLVQGALRCLVVESVWPFLGFFWKKTKRSRKAQIKQTKKVGKRQGKARREARAGPCPSSLAWSPPPRLKGNFWDSRESQQGFKGKYEVPGVGP